MQLKAANAVLELACKVDAISPIDCLPAQPEKTVRLGSQVGEGQLSALLLVSTSALCMYRTSIDPPTPPTSEGASLATLKNWRSP